MASHERDLGVVDAPKAPDRAKPSAEISDTIKQRLTRGRLRLQQLVPHINVAWEFWRGNHYWHVNQKGVLTQQLSGPTGIKGPGKASWRVREPHNLLIDIVAQEVSAATSRVPGYEVVPTTGSPTDASGARVAQSVAIYGHDKWNLRDAAVQAITHAVVGGEAFAWVYWDSSVGPYIKDAGVGVGEVCVEIYGADQVFWEPGLRFEKSDWHAIDIAMTLEAVKRLDGYVGPDELAKDADILSQSQRGVSTPDRKMVLVTYYLERPSGMNPRGSWRTYANDQEVCVKRDYPGDGSQPCIHRLSYIVDPNNDRDMGLVPHLLPAIRQFDDASNKITEWKNLHMMGGRIFVSPGLLGEQQITDEPGAVYQVMDPNENVKIWEAPSIPPELFKIRDDAVAEMARIAAQNDIPSQVESGRGIVALTEKDASRRGSFLGYVAEWYARVMRSSLTNVQEYYDEERTGYIKGDFGWESVGDFKKLRLSDNADVRVNPATLEPLTRAGVEARVMAFSDRQWISPERAMHAINTGTAENLIKDIELAEARVHRVIRRIKEGTIFEMPTRIVPAQPDPVTGQRIDPATGMPSQTVPGWMPLPWDNLRLWRQTFESWFSTEEAETLEPPMQEAANLIYRQVLDLEAQEAMLQAQRQQAMAAQLGEANAAKPQGPSPSPDMPKLGEGGPGSTPNQPASQSQPS